ncbi:hypothetical protein VTK56DRAFT_5453 [Thermocarpiscus australiensis]
MLIRNPSILLSFLPFLLTSTASPVNTPTTSRAQTNNDGSPAGCTDTSMNSFAWLARSLDYHASYVFSTPSHQNSWGYVSFDLFNPADQTTAHCEAASNQLSEFFYGNMQYKCNDTLRSGSTSFDFSKPTGQLRVNQTWVCDDKEPQWPITFSGRGEANFTLDCTEETYQNPNWTMGQIYSSRDIKCAVIQETRIVPFEMTAVA